MSNRIAVTSILIGLLSLLFFLAGIGTPPYTFFDEPLYVDGARSFLAGTQDLNPEHPPLAKMLMAGAMKVAGDNPTGWRLAGAICGALTLVAVFLWTYLLLDDYALALFAAALTLLNNFLFVMARVAMLDVFYFAFVLWAILAFTASILMDLTLARRRIFFCTSGMLFGLGVACKWNAVVTLAAVGVLAVVLFVGGTHHVRQIGLPTLALGLIAIPIVSYGVIDCILCRRFHLPVKASTIVSINAYIWRYHRDCPGNPALDSRWYQWLFRTSPQRSLSYLMGNFVVVWGGFFALLLCVWKFCKSPALPEGAVILFYAVNLLQWALIPQQRTVYYYYYPPAMFLSVAIAVALSRIRTQHILGVRLTLLIVLAAAAFFAYCYPQMMHFEAPYDCMFGCWP
ncbi:MAG: phospholipid carrier-dependent glycosyltransferase [Candidatus Sulfotelmatobacter sp.]|jgi:dolichyl-phosphate-mannose-protein mannosyltransferase